jgi:hypothetical protein
MRSENDLLLNGKRKEANGKAFPFFDPENCSSFENCRQSIAASVETFQQKC